MRFMWSESFLLRSPFTFSAGDAFSAMCCIRYQNHSNHSLFSFPDLLIATVKKPHDGHFGRSQASKNLGSNQRLTNVPNQAHIDVSNSLT